MKKELQGLKKDTLSIIVVFVLYTSSMLLLLMLGKNAYNGIHEKSQERYAERVCLSYISTKVKNMDGAGKVYLDQFYNLPVLCLEEEYDTVKYQTMIYLYNGWVCEMFSEVGLNLFPEAGTPVFEAESLAFETLDSGLIKVTVNSDSLLIYPRSRTGLAVSRENSAHVIPIKGGVLF